MSSTAMMESARGVFAAAPKTAARPSAAPSSIGIPTRRARTLPSVAPMKKSGVTSPPRKPQPSVTADTARHERRNKRVVLATPDRHPTETDDKTGDRRPERRSEAACDAGGDHDSSQIPPQTKIVGDGIREAGAHLHRRPFPAGAA